MVTADQAGTIFINRQMIIRMDYQFAMFYCRMIAV
jgi:hypothetical protein